MTENATLKYIQWITRYESTEYIFVCAVSALTFFCGLHWSQSLDVGGKQQNNT